MTTFSVLLAWDINDMEQGIYGCAVNADNYTVAEEKARAFMHGSGNKDITDAYGDDEPVVEYEVLEIIEGANIWAAPKLLEALKLAETKLVRLSKQQGVYNTSGTLDVIRAAIAEGENVEGYTL